MDGFEHAATRDSFGRFVPGASGNPAGKKPGTRNRKTILMEALRDGEDTTVARVVIDKAVAGDAVAARFLLRMLTPPQRGREIELDLPEGTTAGDIIAAFDATLAAMAAGEITPDEALIVTRILDGKRRALETAAAERRAEEARVAARQTAAVAADERPADAGAAAAPLHSPCNSPSPAAVRQIFAGLPAQQQRLIAALGALAPEPDGADAPAAWPSPLHFPPGTGMTASHI
ncbi:MAG: hypothetical protein JWL84_2753 [Rhodospirillales bacterium]|nr:hypothetical protein [Rhodospirillales bacterium]